MKGQLHKIPTFQSSLSVFKQSVLACIISLIISERVLNNYEKPLKTFLSL